MTDTSLLERRLTQILKDAFGPLDVVCPPDLYHYTSAHGLMGIVQSKKIWATHYRYLNDFAEFDHGRQMAAECLGEAMAKNDDPLLGGQSALDSIVSFMLKSVHSFMSAEKAILSYYVACFCAKDDLLSQWRGYANSGAGYSIKLSPTGREIRLRDLSRCPADEVTGTFTDLGFNIVKLDYSDHSECVGRLIGGASDFLRTECERIVPRMASLGGDEIRASRSGGRFELCYQVALDLAGVLFGSLMQVFIRMKNPGFREEDEWRIVIVDWAADSKTFPKKFRVSNGILVPYIEIELMEVNGTQLFQIDSVRCGPGSHSEEAQLSVQMLLLENGMPHATVAASAIPLKA